jgi:plasmid replication initiation protein
VWKEAVFVQTAELIETSTNKLVTKSNMLIEANYKLGVVEQKIILCLASNIQPNDSDFKTYTLPVKEFNKLLGLKGTPKYSELRQTTKELMQKVFEVRINKKVIQVAWLSYVAYNESEGTIDIRFDPFLRPYLLELKSHFTSYKLENVVKLKSSYAIRIYELLKQYEKLQERTFLLSDLRKMLGAEDIYPAYGNFKQRVLVPAQKELKKKTDIHFEIDEIKTGRRVEKVKFIINSVSKTYEREQLELFEDNLQEFQSFNSYKEKVKKLALKLGIRVSESIIKSWEKHGQDNVIDLMEKMQQRTDIKNPIGYISKVLNSIESNDNAEETDQKENILTHLITRFRGSKEFLPFWFVQEEAIDELQNHFGMNSDQAIEMFESLKSELFEVLNINEPETEKLSEQEQQERLKQIQLALEQIRG